MGNSNKSSLRKTQSVPDTQRLAPDAPVFDKQKSVSQLRLNQPHEKPGKPGKAGKKHKQHLNEEIPQLAPSDAAFLPEFPLRGELEDLDFHSQKIIVVENRDNAENIQTDRTTASTGTKYPIFVLGVIARGAYGNVIKVQREDEKKFYAVKVLEKAQIIQEGAIRQCKDEATIQSMAGEHSFVVKAHEYWQSSGNLYIVLDYVPYGDMFTLWTFHGAFPEKLVQVYIAEMAMVIDFLHNASVIYRDIKMENILFNAKGHIQLTDFGLAKWLQGGDQTRTVCGTLQYMAPEVLSVYPYGHSADWWSLGILMYAMLAGRYPVDGADTHTKMAQKVFESDFFLPSNISDSAQDVINSLLTKSPHKRLCDVNSLQDLDFFQDIFFADLIEQKLNPLDVVPEDFFPMTGHSWAPQLLTPEEQRDFDQFDDNNDRYSDDHDNLRPTRYNHPAPQHHPDPVARLQPAPQHHPDPVVRLQPAQPHHHQQQLVDGRHRSSPSDQLPHTQHPGEKLHSHQQHPGEKLHSHQQHPGEKLHSHQQHPGEKLHSHQQHPGEKLHSHQQHPGEKLHIHQQHPGEKLHSHQQHPGEKLHIHQQHPGEKLHIHPQHPGEKLHSHQQHAQDHKKQLADLPGSATASNDNSGQVDMNVHDDPRSHDKRWEFISNFSKKKDVNKGNRPGDPQQTRHNSLDNLLQENNADANCTNSKRINGSGEHIIRSNSSSDRRNSGTHRNRNSDTSRSNINNMRAASSSTTLNDVNPPAENSHRISLGAEYKTVEAPPTLTLKTVAPASSARPKNNENNLSYGFTANLGTSTLSGSVPLNVGEDTQSYGLSHKSDYSVQGQNSRFRSHSEAIGLAGDSRAAAQGYKTFEVAPTITMPSPQINFSQNPSVPQNTLQRPQPAASHFSVPSSTPASSYFPSTNYGRLEQTTVALNSAPQINIATQRPAVPVKPVPAQRPPVSTKPPVPVKPIPAPRRSLRHRSHSHAGHLPQGQARLASHLDQNSSVVNYPYAFSTGHDQYVTSEPHNQTAINDPSLNPQPLNQTVMPDPSIDLQDWKNTIQPPVEESRPRSGSNLRRETVSRSPSVESQNFAWNLPMGTRPSFV